MCQKFLRNFKRQRNVTQMKIETRKESKGKKEKEKNQRSAAPRKEFSFALIVT